MSKKVTKWIAVLSKDLKVECFKVEFVETEKQYRMFQGDTFARRVLGYRRVFSKDSQCPLRETEGEALNALDDKCSRLAEAASRKVYKAWEDVVLTHEAIRAYNKRTA